MAADGDDDEVVLLAADGLPPTVEAVISVDLTPREDDEVAAVAEVAVDGAVVVSLPASTDGGGRQHLGIVPAAGIRCDHNKMPCGLLFRIRHEIELMSSTNVCEGRIQDLVEIDKISHENL